MPPMTDTYKRLSPSSNMSTTRTEGCSGTTTTTKDPPTMSFSCNGTVYEHRNTFEHRNSQTQAIIYVVVILVLYISILLLLVCRYLRTERNRCRIPYVRSSGILKKACGGRDMETSHLSTVSTQLTMERDSAAAQPTTALLQMDTAV